VLNLFSENCQTFAIPEQSSRVGWVHKTLNMYVYNTYYVLHSLRGDACYV